MKTWRISPSKSIYRRLNQELKFLIDAFSHLNHLTIVCKNEPWPQQVLNSTNLAGLFNLISKLKTCSITMHASSDYRPFLAKYYASQKACYADKTKLSFGSLRLPCVFGSRQHCNIVFKRSLINQHEVLVCFEHPVRSHNRVQDLLLNLENTVDNIQFTLNGRNTNTGTYIDYILKQSYTYLTKLAFTSGCLSSYSSNSPNRGTHIKV